MSIDNNMDNQSIHFHPKPVVATEPVIVDPAALVSASVNPSTVKVALIEPKLAEDINLEQKLLEAKDTLQTHFDVNNKKLNFSVHDDTGRLVVKVVDPDSGEVLKELPSEAVLKMAADIEKFQDNIAASSGLIFDEMV